MEYVYAALVLHKLGKPVDEEGLNLTTIISGWILVFSPLLKD